MAQTADFQNESITRAVLYNLLAGALARKVDDSWLNPVFVRNFEWACLTFPARMNS